MRQHSTVFWALTFAWLAAGSWSASAMKPQDQSAALLELLMSPDAAARFIVPCRESSDLLLAEKELVSLGLPAVPTIERALDRIAALDSRSQETQNADRILRAYARIKGPTSVPRLMQMADNAKMASLQIALDESLAVALSLTSVVSFRPGKTVLRTDSITSSSCRDLMPLDGLDRLIVAWKASDRGGVEASLSPAAQEEFHRLLTDKNWDVIRADVWRGGDERATTVGYRFAAGFLELTDYMEISATFQTASGADCGTVKVPFEVTPLIEGTDEPKRYRVDSPGLSALLRVISSCGAPPR